MEKKDICSNCGNTDVRIDTKEGNLVCYQGCGLILKSRVVDEDKEYRNFSEGGGGQDRVGAAINSYIGVVATEQNGRGYRTSSDGNATKYKAMSRMKEIASKIQLEGSIVDRALDIFFKCEENKGFKGKNIEALICSCLYAACKDKNYAVHKDTFLKNSNIDLVDFRKALREIMKKVSVKIVDLEQYTWQFCSKLNLPNEVRSAAMDATNYVKKRGYEEGKNPRTIASACIYIVCQASIEHKRSTKDIAEVANIAENTIKSCYKGLQDYFSEILAVTQYKDNSNLLPQ